MNASSLGKSFVAFAVSLVVSSFDSRATTLYSTTFPSPPYFQNQAWVGIDG